MVSYTEEEILTALRACDNNKSATAQRLGITRSSLRRRLNKMALKPEPTKITPPDIPPDDLPIEELIEIQSQRFIKRQKAHQARKWQPIRIDTDEPVVIAFVGDPHLDDNGCNWPLLRRHIEIMSQENVLAVNIGDTTNNWTGRLMRLYAKQETSLKTARRFADWFMHDAGVSWLAWLIGNHDEWEQGHEILARMNTNKIVMENWQVQFRVVFSNGFEVPIWCSHNFPGNSQWNKLHGPMKAAMMRGGAGVYACGHTHTWGVHFEELTDTGQVVHIHRSRGYKTMDEYAMVHGYAENKLGATTAVVIDPKAESQAEAITSFECLEKAVVYRDGLS